GSATRPVSTPPGPRSRPPRAGWWPPFFPLPMGEGLSARERSDRLRSRVRVAGRPSASAAAPPAPRLAPTETADPHPALRATFSHREKENRPRPIPAHPAFRVPPHDRELSHPIRRNLADGAGRLSVRHE